ncbi:MAG: hypothetical protein IJV80_05980, partial [Clostridia bacterium]|nr:hypothetical protein [Clostridia bacterium]
MKTLLLSNLKLSPEQSEEALLKIAEKKLGKKPKYFEILKKSLDARDKSASQWVDTVACCAL